MSATPESLQNFVTFCKQHIKGQPTSQLFKLHAQLDKQVMQAYGFNSSDDILEKLLELNLEFAEKEKQGEPVLGPWAPN